MILLENRTRGGYEVKIAIVRDECPSNVLGRALMQPDCLRAVAKALKENDIVILDHSHTEYAQAKLLPPFCSIHSTRQDIVWDLILKIRQRSFSRRNALRQSIGIKHTRRGTPQLWGTAEEIQHMLEHIIVEAIPFAELKLSTEV